MKRNTATAISLSDTFAGSNGFFHLGLLAMTAHTYTDFYSSLASHTVSHNAILVLHLCVQEATMCWMLAFRKRVRLDDILPSWLLILHISQDGLRNSPGEYLLC